MITPMRKVSLLCLDSERERAVQALRTLGILHVEHRPAEQAHPASAETASQRDATRRALGILGALPPLPRHAPAPAGKAPTPGTVAEILARTAESHAEAVAMDEQMDDLLFEREALLPFGHFDLEPIRELARRGVPTHLFRVPSKKPFPSGDGCVEICHLDGLRFGVAFGALPEGIDGLEPVAMPARSLDEVERQVQATESARARLNAELHALAEGKALLEAHANSLDEAYRFQLVAESLGAHGPIASLDGFCPLPKVPMLQEAARTQGWALWIREPEANDNVPVTLDLPRWLRPISILFKGLGILPGYREADVSAVFLLFFSVFFAMLVGDAGYGALMFAAVLFARRKKPKAPAQPFWLFGVFAVVTIAWGVLTGSYFAIDRALLPPFLRGLPWLLVDNHVMGLCFLIGGAHLTVAHLWNAIVLLPSRKALAQLGWIGVVWLMFFIAANLVIGLAMPGWAPWMGGLGVLLIALFMTDPKDFKEEWINHPMLVLNLISCLVDVISYIRLFAVGMASAQIALNFNQMAAGLPLPPWVKPLGMVLILVLGHGLNLVLGALSILVHAVRLNTLEFSNHKGLTWSGQPYTPFRKNDAPFNA